MSNSKHMYHEKNSDENDHFKTFGHQKVFSIFIQKSAYFLPFSLKISSTKEHFFSKIFGLKSSKLRRFFNFWKWAKDKDEDEDGCSAKNL